MDLIAHLTRQAAVSRAIFGPGARTAGVSDHIKKELKEIAACHPDDDEGRAAEWVDVAILGLDGLLRAISVARPGATCPEIAATAAQMIAQKQSRNEMRDWPDWRTAPKDKAIEHVRTAEETAAKAAELEATSPPDFLIPAAITPEVEFEAHYFGIPDAWRAVLAEIAKAKPYTDYRVSGASISVRYSVDTCGQPSNLVIG